MIALRTEVLAGVLSEPAVVIGREPLPGGGCWYRVRFPDGRVRAFGSRWVRLAVQPVVRMPVRLRLIAVDGARV